MRKDYILHLIENAITYPYPNLIVGLANLYAHIYAYILLQQPT